MLKIMRKNEFARNAIIVFVCAAMAAYVLVGFGSAPPTAPDNKVAKIGSSQIKVRDISMAKTQYRQTYNDRSLWSYASNQLFIEAILKDGANDAGINVSDDELRDTIINYRTLEDGTFIDDEQWARNIQGSYRQRVSTFENHIRENGLKPTKFRSVFYDGIYVSDSEIMDRFQENNKKVKLEMLTLTTTDVREQTDLSDDAKLRTFFDSNADKFKTGDQRRIQYVSFGTNNYEEGIAVTEADIQSYYDANSQRYQKPDQVQASHILLKFDNRSEEEALKEITDIKAEVDGGLDFAEAAKKFSEDGSAAAGGDLGFFGFRDMVEPFAQSAFAMAIGEISEPVKTQFGYHIIKKIAARPASIQPIEEVKASITATLKREKSREAAQKAAGDFHAMIVSGKDFVSAAGESAYEIKVTPFFDNDNNSSLGEDLGNNFQVRSATFRLAQLNDVTEPINAAASFVVAQWIEEDGPRTMVFDEDLNRIRAEAQKIAGRTFIENIFAEVRDLAGKDSEKSIKDLLGDRDFLKDNHFKTTDLVSANTLPWEIRNDDMDFDNEIYSKEPGSFLDRTETSFDQRLVLARLLEKEAPDESKISDERISIADQIRAEKGGQLLASYLFTRQTKLDPSGSERAKINAVFGERN